MKKRAREKGDERKDGRKAVMATGDTESPPRTTAVATGDSDAMATDTLSNAAAADKPLQPPTGAGAGAGAGAMLDFLKTRVAGFEQERAALLDRVDTLVESRGEEHSLLWELKRSSEEVHALQKALSDAHAFLFEERERLLALRAENDELKIQELEDRRRIQHLLKLTAPFEEDVTFERGIRPDAITVRPPPQGPVSDRFTAAGSGGTHTHPHPGGGGPPAERIVRTIYLPTANTDTLILRVEALQAQLEEQRRFADERVAALLEDRRIREKDKDEARLRLGARVDALTERLASTEALLQRVTRDLLQARRLKDAAEAEAAGVVHEAQEAKRGAEALAARTDREIEEAREGIQARADEYVSKFRAELREKEAEVLRMETVYATMKAAFEKRVADLEGKNGRLRAANLDLEARRAMDVEGFTATITSLRQRLKSLERTQLTMRLEERVKDEDRLDVLYDRLKLERRGGARGKEMNVLAEMNAIRQRLEGLGSVVEAL